MQRRLGINIALFIIIGLILWYGIFVLKGEEYYTVSMAIIVVGLLGFLLCFENSKPSVELLAMLAALCGFAIAARIAFFFLPQIKPIAAVIIIAGVAFGAEAGFVMGAVSAFVSNFYFGQGAWTPFQMFALGLIGYFAGVIFRKRKHKVWIALYGFFAVVIFYGGIVDLNTLFYASREPTKSMVMAVYLQGLPYNAMFGASTAVFLFLLYEPIIRRLDRICRKYRFVDKVDEK